MTGEQERDLGRLMTEAQNGDRLAYETLLTRVVGLLQAFVRRRVGEASWSELGDGMDRANFAFEAALLIVTALSAAVGALVASVPGLERSARVRWVPVVAAAASVVWAAGELFFASATGAPTGRLTFAWHSVYKTASVGAVPGMALFMMVRRAAPPHAAWAGMLAVLATAAVGVLGANVICPNDRPLHLLLWHVTPLMLFAALGAALGTRLLQWNRSLR